MSQYTAIARSLTPARFVEVMGASARRARETYFARHAIRAPRTAGFVRAGAKNEARALALHAALGARDDEELCEELLRTYLTGQRPLLVAALDHLGIPHDQGLTEDPGLRRIAELSPAALRELVGVLVGIASRDDVALYLKFMGAPEVDAAMAS